MPRSTLSQARSAMRISSLFLLSAAVIVFAEASVFGQPPAKAEVAELKLRWELELKNAPSIGLPHFDHDGQLVIVSGRVKIEAVSFNARTGKPGPELPITGDYSPYRTFMFEKGKVGFQPGRSTEKALVLWDTVTNKVTNPTIPNMGTGGIPALHFSGNGRYAAVGDYREAKNGQLPETPFRLFDTKTGKTVISMDWPNGTVLFTADNSRALTVDGTDRFRWFKLPSGQADGEWKFEREASRFNGRALSMSGDGGVILYAGVPPKEKQSLHLLDGKTGAVLYSFPAKKYHESYGSISPEGDMVALVRTDGFGTGHSVEVLDIQGTLLARLKAPPPSMPNSPNSFFSFAFSWEARAVALYERASKKLLVYDLPGGSSGAVAVRPKSRDPEGKRDPIPGDAATAKAETTIRQILKDDYAKKTPAEQKALAQKLIKLASETTDDSASRYVMLRDARDFAQGAADPTLTLQAIDTLAKWYQIDGPVQQLAALEKILASTTATATAKMITEAAAASAQAATVVDELDEAVQFWQLSANAARKAKLNPAAIDEADFNLAQAKKSRESFATIRPALEKIQSMPDDPSANLIVGKYRCFVQNRWEDGLKHLAKGEDAALKLIAELDLKAPRTGVPEDAKVADGWWDYSQSAPADTRWAAQARTRYWYAKCLPGLTGLNKAKAEGRLGITVDGNDYRPGLMCELSAKQLAILKGKKARLDPVIDFSGGEFSDGAKQTDMTVKWTGVIAPPRGGRYTLIAQTTNAVRVRVNGKLVIDATSAANAKREAVVILGEQVTPIVVEFFAANTDKHKIKLVWVTPGGTAEESVPAECLFHDKKTENLLGP